MNAVVVAGPGAGSPAASRGHSASAAVSTAVLETTMRSALLDHSREIPRPDVRLVYLQGDQPLIAGRMGRRTGHFMPPTLLASQFAALEEPAADEWPIIVPIELSPRRIVAPILASMAQAGPWAG